MQYRFSRHKFNRRFVGIQEGDNALQIANYTRSPLGFYIVWIEGSNKRHNCETWREAKVRLLDGLRFRELALLE